MIFRARRSRRFRRGVRPIGMCSTPYPVKRQNTITAQIRRRLLDIYQQEFKKHRINILTCSTTMEMGVDLGDLELVEMNSVPPHPANYKQRAGRSGRKGQYHSAAITLCGSDAVGLRTMQNPCQNLIARPFDIPKVDLNSPQLVKRHIAAFMIRSVGDRGNAPRLNDRIIDFFTPYMFDDDREREIVDSDFNSVGPARGLCLDSDETSFFTLRSQLISGKGLPAQQILSSLVAGTALSEMTVAEAAQITVSMLCLLYTSPSPRDRTRPERNIRPISIVPG